MQYNPTPTAARKAALAEPVSDPSIKLQRIAICSVGELFGGVERHILGLLSGLMARGIEPLLIVFHDRELALQAREQGADPIILSPRNQGLFTTSRLLSQILREQYMQLVHVHGYKATVFCGLARCWYSLPVVKTEHGLPETMNTNPLRAARDRLYHWLDQTVTHASVDFTCYVSNDLLVRYQGGAGNPPAVVIPNGVACMSANQFSIPSELQAEHVNLVIAGRLDTVKGHHVAIEAMSSRRLPPAVHLYIIGTGPREPQLRALTESRGLTQRIHFLGFKREIYNYIARCDMLLIPSLHEGLPYTLLEAMALGTPIIASCVGGLAEVLRDGVSGCLVPPGDPGRLAEVIARLCNDIALRRTLGANARATQQALYSLEAMTERYITVYYKTLSCRL